MELDSEKLVHMLELYRLLLPGSVVVVVMMMILMTTMMSKRPKGKK